MRLDNQLIAYVALALLVALVVSLLNERCRVKLRHRHQGYARPHLFLYSL